MVDQKLRHFSNYVNVIALRWHHGVSRYDVQSAIIYPAYISCMHISLLVINKSCAQAGTFHIWKLPYDIPKLITPFRFKLNPKFTEMLTLEAPQNGKRERESTRGIFKQINQSGIIKRMYNDPIFTS